MVETYTGEVRNGVVVFEAGIQPPEGMKVRVVPIGESDEATETLADRLRSVSRSASFCHRHRQRAARRSRRAA